MINYSSPKIETIENPTGIDIEILKLQVILSKLNWLQVVFGRCNKQQHEAKHYNEASAKKSVFHIYPEVFYKNEPYNCMMNDNLNSYCFFYLPDPLKVLDYDITDKTLPVTQPVEIIFWLNIKKIDKDKKWDYPNVLRNQVFAALSISRFKIIESYVEYDQAFRPFTITDTFRNYTKFPYAAFKITGELTYNHNLCD